MFCYNTILSDIAFHFPHTRDEIVSAQLTTLSTLVNKAIKLAQQIRNKDLNEVRNKELLEDKGTSIEKNALLPSKNAIPT